MEKILFKKIGFIFMILLLVITAIFSCYIYTVESLKVEHDVMSQLEQIYAASLSSDKMTAEVDQTFKNDYSNRAYAIDYMLTKVDNIDTNELAYIEDLMQLRVIHLIDKDGNVVKSSNEDALHDNIFNYHEGEKFQSLLQDKEANAIVLWDSVSLLKDHPMVYIGVPSSQKEYQMVLIGVAKSVLENTRYFASIHYMLITTPDKDGIGFFVVDQETGSIVGTTLNNYQSIDIDGVESTQDFIKVLQKSKEGQKVVLNGKLRYLRVIEENGRFYCGYYDGDGFWKQILQEILYVTLSVSAMFICILILLRVLIKKVVINDLRGIETGIRSLIQGDYDFVFTAQYPTEFQDIVSVMNDWKDSYRYKSNRMTRITSAIGEYIGTFECLFRISKNFFSDNVRDILGLDDDEWEKVSTTPQSFEEFITSLQRNHTHEDGIIYWKQKYLKISSFHRHGEFYGMVMDCSKDMIAQHRMKDELASVKQESLTDVLTKLANRKKLEMAVNDVFNEPYPSGMMLIIDLDNFKRVNDKAGHPEGDKVLILFSQVLLRFFRRNDVVARIGGDEFVVFMENIMPDHVLHQKMSMLLQNIRDELSEYYQKYEVSASIGIAYIDNRIRTFDELYRCADNALYKAKRNGKDTYFVNEENKRCLTGNCVACIGKCDRKDLSNLG